MIQAGGTLIQAGGTLIQAGSPGAGDSKTTLSRHKEGGDLAAAQEVWRVQLPLISDGGGMGNAVPAGGAES